LEETPVLRPARPSGKSRWLTLRTRKARGSTTGALPQQRPLAFAHSTYTQRSWMIVLRALRANYVHPAVPHDATAGRATPAAPAAC
jgi:hypothetical protein